MIENNVFRRTLALGLFMLSMLGPWMFDLIHVPAQYDCDTPFVRLSGDFCGYPLSGLETIKWFGGGVLYTVAELIKGNFASRIPELLMLMGISIIGLPFFGLLLLLGYPISRRLQSMTVLGCGLACLPALVMFILQTNRDQFVQFFYWLWGLGLYILLAIGTIVFEILRLRSDTKTGMNS
jgi:hypothetical protein